MPWFAVGDSTYDHPKALAAGNAAMGLWLRCGAYASAHLTDGVIPGAVAAKNGTATQIRKLLASGLWHTARHSCAACPQVRDGDFVMHDYLDANPSRQQVQDRRRRAAEKKRQQRDGGQPAADDDDSPPNRWPNWDGAGPGAAGQRPPSRGDAVGPRARRAPSSPSRREGAGVGAMPAGGWGPPRRHPLPDGFAPDEAALRWADADGHTGRLGGQAGLAATTAAFADWHRGRGTQAADWSAMWRKWIREQRAPVAKTPGPAPRAARRPRAADAAQVSVAERFAGIERQIEQEQETDRPALAGPPASRPLTLVDPPAFAGCRQGPQVMPGQRPLMAALPGGLGEEPDTVALLEAIAEHGQANAVAMYGWRRVAALLAIPGPAFGGG
ncbi:hypothetical protein OG196_31670 [Kitasatospora purpeofusca]|uniref:hypothetical protein n=1 Tax=Kitasatospora purpeofusca TaxID=67352 RepID=UPI002E1137CD|nr:hypothetical protein OG196_31670 [Kitasatospora purpeofusca]